jgi:hypothetical protein
VITSNLGNLWRRLALSALVDNWWLTSLKQRLAKTGGRLIKHARYNWAPGGEPSDASAFWEHAAEDRNAAVAGGNRGSVTRSRLE